MVSVYGHELAQYLTFAVEMRRRGKEQLKRINPTEFANTDLTFIDKETGEVFSAPCPEIRDVREGSGTGVSPVPACRINTVAAADPIESFHGYDLLQNIESGGMAEAYMARNQKTGDIVFLKRVRKTSADKDALEREVRIYERLMRMNTKHVLQVLDFVRDNEFVALVTQYADGGDLNDHAESSGKGRGLPVDQAQEIGLNIALALKELHDHDVVHRDLKPQNVLLVGNEWKLADFGISKNRARVVTQKTFQQYGTLGYAAPEQF